jgi:hypothetical protein
MKKISFRFNIAAIFTALIIGTTTLIISFNYLRSVEIVGDSSDRITSFASQRIISQTLNFLYTGQEAVDLLNGYLDFNDLEEDQEEIFRFMWNLLNKKTNLASLYIGDSLGSFYQVRKEPELASGAILRSTDGSQVFSLDPTKSRLPSSG